MWQVDNSRTALPNGADNANPGGVAIYNLAIDTGKGNSGAKGMDIRGDRLDHTEDLQIRSGGIAAVSMNARTKGARKETVAAAAGAPPTGTTPEVPWGDIHKDWMNVEKFADKKAGDDWGPAIQAAIDSGARSVYFPAGRYEVLSAVHVHGKIDRLFGLRRPHRTRKWFRGGRAHYDF